MTVGRVIERVIEAGLIPVWKDRTCQRMKAMNLAAGVKSVVVETLDDNAPLTATDFQGLAYVSALLLVVSLAAFLAEFIARALTRANERKRKRNRTRLLLRAVRVA
jgi:hypothetical protein